METLTQASNAVPLPPPITTAPSVAPAQGPLSPMSPTSAVSSLLLFSHPAARLVKSIPPRETPRINGNLPRDLLGPGLPNQATTETTGAILHDWQGPLKLYAVPDRLSQNDTAGNLVFSIETTNSSTPTYGAEARKHLPFRSYGQQTSMPKDTIPRPTYLGLGAGSQGGDGGSFWFLEDVSEFGGSDRWRWAQDGVGNRAVWTVWLFGAPSPVVDHLRQILDSYPTMPPALPPFLQNGAPWHDSFAAKQVNQEVAVVPAAPADLVAETNQPTTRRPLPPTPPLQSNNKPPTSPKDDAAPTSIPVQVFSDVTNMQTPTEPKTSKEKPQLPSLPIKPPLLRHLSSYHEPASALPFTPLGASPLTAAHQDAPGTPDIRSRRPIVDRNDDKRASVDDINATIGSVPALASIPSAATAEEQEPESGGASTSDTTHRRSSPSSEYRHSLVAVDSDTGAVIGVVAHNVYLSEDGGQHTRTQSESTSTSATPQPSVLRPATTYRDEDALRAPSRRNSVLAADTFAPPPLPIKKDHTLRDSVISRSDAENFLSAKEYQTGVEDVSSDDEEVRAGFTSFDGGKHHIVESHRPDLLVDDEDEGAASDASGSTIGGPAVKLWRKARGGKEGEKKRAAKKAAKELLKHTAHRDRELQVSEASSVRTSRAETAREGDDEGGLSEDDDEDEEEEPPLVPNKSRDPSVDTLATLDADPTTEEASTESERKRRLHGHIPRADMLTADIISTEDRLWREAFDGGQLPIDGAYTHLAASYDTNKCSDIAEADEEEEADLSLDPAARDAPELNLVRKGNKYLQGGTVLIEFLAGSTITASVIGPRTVQQVAQADSASSSNEVTAADGGGGLLSLIPALPSHIFGFLMGSEKKQTDQTTANDSNETPSSTGLLSTWTSALTNWSPTSPLSSWFNWLSTSSPPSQSTISSDKEEEEEWEVAIPNFDPKSLASTPRPVYRRKRPAPSFENGYQVRQQSNRYSIIHFDGDGIGRRAFVADGPMGVPGLHAAGMGFGAVL